MASLTRVSRAIGKCVHLAIVCVVIVVWLITGKRFCIVSPLISHFGVLVAVTPASFQNALEAGRFRQKLVCFVGIPYLQGNSWKMNKLREYFSSHLITVEFWPLRLFYAVYKLGHCDDPIYQTLLRFQSRFPTLFLLRKIAWKDYPDEVLQSSDAPELLNRSRNLSRGVFELSQNEMLTAAKLLSDRGFRRGKHRGLILLNCRDSRLRRTRHRGHEGVFKHARDMDMCVYVPALQRLVSEGYFIVRAGAVQEPIPFYHASFWDYGAGDFHLEALDLYLGKECDFCISTGSGADVVARIHAKPLAIIGLYGTWRYFGKWDDPAIPDVFVPKAVWSVEQGRILGLSEAFYGEEVHLSLERHEGKYTVLDLSSPDYLYSLSFALEVFRGERNVHAMRAHQMELLSKSALARLTGYTFSWSVSEHPLIPPDYLADNASWILE